MYCWEAANSFAICSLSASANDLSGIGAPLWWAWLAGRKLPVPAKAGRRGGRLERARRKSVGHRGVVVAGGGDVVGGVGMEERREVLELAAAHSLLSLTAAVDRDLLAPAVLVDGEELAQRAEARRLRVDRPRRPIEGLDVGHRVERCVPGDPVRMRLQHGPGLVVQVRVLQVGAREGL